MSREEQESMATTASEQVTMNIQEKLKLLPARPGVYLMNSESDEIIFVGKAVSLRKRVRFYV